jgi:hypothetical protein
MKCSDVTIDTIQHFNPTGLIERQNSQYPQYLYPHISWRDHIYNTAFESKGHYWTRIYSIFTVPVPSYFLWNTNMNCITVDIYTKQYSNCEGFNERQYSQYPLNLYPPISVETRIWTVGKWPDILYSIWIQRALLKVDIFILPWTYIQNSILIVRGLLYVNILIIHWICTLKFQLNL